MSQFDNLTDDSFFGFQLTSRQRKELVAKLVAKLNAWSQLDLLRRFDVFPNEKSSCVDATGCVPDLNKDMF